MRCQKGARAGPGQRLFRDGPGDEVRAHPAALLVEEQLEEPDLGQVGPVLARQLPRSIGLFGPRCDLVSDEAAEAPAELLVLAALKPRIIYSHERGALSNAWKRRAFRHSFYFQNSLSSITRSLAFSCWRPPKKKPVKTKKK